MKKKYILLLGMIFSFFACHDEGSLTAEYNYDEPIPAIADGPSEAQKLCYSLYQKYDLHAYYTLEGDEALRTPVGWTQTSFQYYVPDAYPLQAGDEATSASFLKLMVKFFNLLPDELVKSATRRHVLVKVSPAEDRLMLPWPVSIAYTDEAQQGIIYWGAMDDEIGVDADLWKYSLSFAYFETRTSTYFHKDLPILWDFMAISNGKYFYDYSDAEQDEVYEQMVIWDEESGEPIEMNMDYLMDNGFVSPYGMMMAGMTSYPYLDMVTYAVWIVNTPLVDRQEILDNYPLVRLKYDLTIKYYKEHLDLDLEAFGKEWVKVAVE